MQTKTTDPRGQARAIAEAKLEKALDAAARAGFYGRVELSLQDGFCETIRLERTERIERPRQAAAA